MAKVSVIVPTYNAEKHLKACLDSLVNQTLDDIEIIVIDDASTDNSLQILKEYASKYPQIKAYYNKVNCGQGKTRNFGLDIASGEYIGFVDSDDVIENTMYETMYNGALENNYVDIVSVGINFVDINFQKKDEYFNPRFRGILTDIDKTPEDILNESPSCCNKIFKSSLIDDYRFLEDCTWEDVAFTYSLLLKADKKLTYPDKYYCYRRNLESGVSSKGYKIDSPLEDIFKVANEIETQANLNGKEEKFSKVGKIIQTATCFQRLNEISEWEEYPKEMKLAKMVEFYQNVTEKYGDYTELDTGLLSSKVSLIVVEKIKKIVDEYTFEQTTKKL